ncbi:MAG: septal ring lytic transglycosylase RlpA family protein [Methylacidiphilales bacterium]|nr:septal ring lytic transglycosylase RlpA family protein [Candidatus Methylacidiphilales bacterium]
MLRFRFLIVLTALAGLVLSFSPAYAMGPKRYHEGETQRGLASWYGSEQRGDLTADGERFDPGQLTAAHRRLPFGTIVRVTNRTNGLSVEVRINDRGPYGDGDRIIDVSSAAADILQMKKSGVVPVEIEIIRLGSPSRANQG